MARKKSSTCFYAITIHLVKNTSFACPVTCGGEMGCLRGQVVLLTVGLAHEKMGKCRCSMFGPITVGFQVSGIVGGRRPRADSEGTSSDTDCSQIHAVPKPQFLRCLCCGLHSKAGDFGGVLPSFALRSPGFRLCSDFPCSFWALSSELVGGFCPDTRPG